MISQKKKKKKTLMFLYNGLNIYFYTIIAGTEEQINSVQST